MKFGPKGGASKAFRKAMAKARSVPKGERGRPDDCPVYATPCALHGFIHGAEAEELRDGVEALIAGADDDVDRDARVVSVADLQDMLDAVDARDSCAFAERRPKKRSAGRSGSEADRG